MKFHWTWKEGLRFAFAKEFRSTNTQDLCYPMNYAEKFGTLYLSPLHKMIDWISCHIQKPLIIILFTLLMALLTVLLFYNIPVFIILDKLFPSNLVRFFFFTYIETHLFGLGCRAFGRFNNPTLISLWKSGKLTPIFPGDL